jgi:hypothetical protein
VALLNDAQIVPFENERVSLLGFRGNQLSGHLPKESIGGPTASLGE